MRGQWTRGSNTWPPGRIELSARATRTARPRSDYLYYSVGVTDTQAAYFHLPLPLSRTRRSLRRVDLTETRPIPSSLFATAPVDIFGEMAVGGQPRLQPDPFDRSISFFFFFPCSQSVSQLTTTDRATFMPDVVLPATNRPRPHERCSGEPMTMTTRCQLARARPRGLAYGWVWRLRVSSASGPGWAGLGRGHGGQRTPAGSVRLGGEP